MGWQSSRPIARAVALRLVWLCLCLGIACCKSAAPVRDDTELNLALIRAAEVDWSQTAGWTGNMFHVEELRAAIEGADKTSPKLVGARKKYGELLEGAFAEPVRRTLEKELNELSPDHFNDLLAGYEALETYLLFGDVSHLASEKEHQGERVKRVLLDENLVHEDKDVVARIVAPHVANYLKLVLEGVVRPTLSDTAVANARAALRRRPHKWWLKGFCTDRPASAYDSETRDLKYPDVTLSALLGDKRKVFEDVVDAEGRPLARPRVMSQHTRGVRAAALTCLAKYRGFVFQPWVIPLDAEERKSWESLAPNLAEIEQMYADEYLADWRRLFREARIGSLGSAKDRIELVTTLTTGKLPLDVLVAVAADDLADVPGFPSLPSLLEWVEPLSAARKPGGILEQWHARLTKLRDDLRQAHTKGGNPAALLRAAADDVEKLLAAEPAIEPLLGHLLRAPVGPLKLK